MNKVFSFLLLVTAILAHVQYVEKEAIVSNKDYVFQNGDDFSFEYPFDLTAPGTISSGPNPMEDGRFVSSYLHRNDDDWVKFNVTVANSTCNAAPWSAFRRQDKDSYVNVAFVGPLSDKRFSPLSASQANEYNIRWRNKIPAGYGVVLGINTPPPRNAVRPDIIITLPVGEIPNRWYLPYNSGELDPDAIAFRQFKMDESTGKGGCFFPPQRCPGSPYPFNSTNPFCPHYKVGNFCGPKPWRWINEVNLGIGTYYLVFWERNGRAVDTGYFLGWNEALRFGYRTDIAGCSSTPFAPACRCGATISFELPPNCVANFPAARERTKIVYSLLTGEANWH